MQNNVLDYLDEIVTKVPNKNAFVDEYTAYTFADVDRISKSIGSFLHEQEKGGYKAPVLVYMRKSVKTIVTFFGIIRSGCFYVPIDEEMPESRIRLIIENCSPEILICDNDTLPSIGKLNFGGKVVNFEDICDHQINHDALEQIHRNALDIDPIYIVFTSGSTGVPKGVCACHRSVIDYIEQLSDVLRFHEGTVFGNQTPLYFDACLKELYPTLKFGATTYLIPHELFMFPTKLVEYLNEKKINTICWVVSALTMISAFGTLKKDVPKYLETIAFGSEVFPIKQFRMWRTALPNTKFFNLYGPTEGTGMCCYYPVTREFEDHEPIPVGFPFKNTQILLLNEENQLVADGEEGEICIRGTSVTLGYYNNPEKTKESFVQNPLNTAYPELIYRTGDIGRRNERGELVFVSRKDYQIKHMGHRIELGEVESNVDMLDSVKMSACIYDDKRHKIVLYYVGTDTPAELMEALKDKLPRYMLPNRMINLPALPFTANGKIDRKTLKQKYEEKE